MKTKILALFFMVTFNAENPLFALLDNTACNLTKPAAIYKSKDCHKECNKTSIKPVTALGEHQRVLQLLKKMSDNHLQNKKVKVRLYLIVI